MRSTFRWLLPALLVVPACSSSSRSAPDLDGELADLLNQANVSAPTPPIPPALPLVTLGRALMFDKELSGNRNIACATCHHPVEHTTDGIPLSIGQGGTGLGPSRQSNGKPFIPRHAPNLFNLGLPLATVQFWDGRVALNPAGGFKTPAGAATPSGLSGTLAAQSLFPITSPDEMRGYPGDLDVNGQTNELAVIADTDFVGIWDGIMTRLRAIPAYDTLFTTAYPGVALNTMGIRHAANAIAAFETAVWTRLDSPFDNYLRGDKTALTDAEKRGATIFFGKARCGQCHGGPLLSDFKFHNIGIPQLGPGKGPMAGIDPGRQLETGVAGDAFAFKTTPLRNVALTAPYMHNGAFSTLAAVMTHYNNVPQSLASYDASQLPAALQGTVHTDQTTLNAILATLDPKVIPPLGLTQGELDDVVAFMQSLTDPTALDQTGEVPSTVPSGLPVGN